MVTVVRNGHRDPCSNPGRDFISQRANTLGETYESTYFSSSYGKIVGLAGLFNIGMATGLGENRLMGF